MPPLYTNLHHAYLAGACHGDAWQGTSIGLRCADHDFAIAFTQAIWLAHGVIAPAAKDERGYWLVRTNAKLAQVSDLKGYQPATRLETGAWLRGYFDSEGNSHISKAKNCNNGFNRRVAFYSTNIATLRVTRKRLSAFGISSAMRNVKLSDGHMGVKPVYEVKLLGSRENYERFLTVVGSSIARKLHVLQQIVASYTDLLDRIRSAQKKGAASRRRKTLDNVLPGVVSAIATMLPSPTVRKCSGIPGYHAVRHYFTHTELLEMATGGHA